ncbi:nuclear transport factor 2 family protein [Litoribacter ruber]|uniref:nuclear transport factor 2 family protein n=1 Tax=Litoribacter ruber TaxID=702568 RepID=UPI001BD94963|nr:nuclear transport factor 2 family protein [Litoribacter ruber]MBT0811612.1 nuclear transport factor 2 family protein [Litoribacter ruber]
METINNTQQLNKALVEAFDEAFSRGDYKAIADLMAEDVEWKMVGEFHLKGKGEIQEMFKSMEGMGLPEIWPSSKVAEGDRIVAEGTMKALDREGKIFRAAYVDSYLINNGKIKVLTSYVTTIKDDINQNPG